MPLHASTFRGKVAARRTKASKTKAAAGNWRKVERKNYCVVLRGQRKSRVEAPSDRTLAILALNSQPGNNFFAQPCTRDHTRLIAPRPAAEGGDAVRTLRLIMSIQLNPSSRSCRMKRAKKEPGRARGLNERAAAPREGLANE